MVSRHRKMILYTQQRNEVVDLLMAEGSYQVKEKYIREKYREVSEVFLKTYHWYTERARLIVPQPEGSESAIWAFTKKSYLPPMEGTRIIEMKVPIREAVFFRMVDWNKVLNRRYLGSEEEATAFAEELVRQGIGYYGDVYDTPFYPGLKKELIVSWNRLFRYDKEIKLTQKLPYDDMQAGLWCIKSQWVMRII